MVTVVPPTEIAVVIILLGFAGIPLACLALIVWLMRKSPESFFLGKQSRSLYRRVVNTEAQELLSCPHFFKYLKTSKKAVVPDECLNCQKLIECVKNRERKDEETEKGHLRISESPLSSVVLKAHESYKRFVRKFIKVMRHSNKSLEPEG